MLGDSYFCFQGVRERIRMILGITHLGFKGRGRDSANAWGRPFLIPRVPGKDSDNAWNHSLGFQRSRMGFSECLGTVISDSKGFGKRLGQYLE